MLDLDMLRGSNNPLKEKDTWGLVKKAVSYLEWLGSEPGAMNDDGYGAMRTQALELLEKELQEAGVLFEWREQRTTRNGKRYGYLK